MKRISGTTQKLIFLSIFTLMAMLGYYLLFSEIRDLNIQASLLEGEVNITTKQESRVRLLRSTIEDTRADRATLDSFFLMGNDIVDFLEVVEGLKSYTGAEISVRSIGEGVMESNELTQELTLSVTAEGVWEEVYHFFTLIESLPYRIHLNQVQLSSTGLSRNDILFWSGVFNFTVTQLK